MHTNHMFSFHLASSPTPPYEHDFYIYSGVVLELDSKIYEELKRTRRRRAIPDISNNSDHSIIRKPEQTTLHLSSLPFHEIIIE